MLRLLFVSALFMLSFVNAVAQRSPVYIVAAGGTNFTSGNLSISYTIGEPEIKTITGGGMIVTQGFHQNNPLHADTLPSLVNNVELFPNPVSKTLYVRFQIEDINSYALSIFTVTGREVDYIQYPSLYNGEVKEIDFSYLPKGVYLIRVFSSDKVISRIFKIEKL